MSYLGAYYYSSCFSSVFIAFSQLIFYGLNSHRRVRNTRCLANAQRLEYNMRRNADESGGACHYTLRHWYGNPDSAWPKVLAM